MENTLSLGWENQLGRSSNPQRFGFALIEIFQVSFQFLPLFRVLFADNTEPITCVFKKILTKNAIKELLKKFEPHLFF